VKEENTMLCWQIGDIKITRILEQETALPGDFLLPASTPAAVAGIPWLKPHFIDEAGLFRLSIHALVVETPDTLVVVDTCAGNDKTRTAPVFHRLQTDFLDHFAAAGYRPEDVDVVLCTHLHVDHVGWNTRLVDGRWVPTFANARYLLGRQEVEHWRSCAAPGDEGLAFADSVQPLFDAGLVDLVETGHAICPGVSLVPTPGHTPGHVSVKLSSQGQEALITGDMIHHPAQLARPEWACFIDADPDQGIATRRRIFSALAGSGVLVIGTHFAAPTAGFVVGDGDSWILV